MRLLRTDKLELVHFPGQDVPPFVILSHTWEDEEVLFQDIQQGTAASRRGIQKVYGACEQARKDGFKYIWIDTCCIDKTSSAELSEAINSMFQWYGDADVCYAFLSDVDGSEDPHYRDSGFQKSRWFTRGWTLQELIAPPIVIFYDENWNEIGSRSKLQPLIVSITNINAEYFETMDLSQFSAAQKMSWASNRQTTRAEDMAYCLLGLFDINMPLLYGEGEKAFLRLQEEILRQSEDDSLFYYSNFWQLESEDHALFSSWNSMGQDALASSPSWFRNCGDVVKRDTEAYRRVPSSLLLNRGLAINKKKIEMTFLVAQPTAGAVSSSDLHCQTQPIYYALLNCANKDSPTTSLVISLVEEQPGSGVFSQAIHSFVVRKVATAEMMTGATPMRVILGRKPEQRRERSTWGFGGLSQAERQKAKWELRSQPFIKPVDPWRYQAQHRQLRHAAAHTTVDTREWRKQTPLRMLRSFGQPGRDAQRAWLLTDDHQEDSFRDKIVFKEPDRTSDYSDFVLKWALNFNYRSLFEVDRWLHLGDEAHIIGTDDVLVCFSSPHGKSFVVRAVASRRAVTVSFVTNFGELPTAQNTQWDTLFWQNLPLKSGTEFLRSSTSESRGDERFSAMGQEYNDHVVVTIEATTKRRADGWWVYLATTPMYELCGD